jgi:TonB family protein
LAPKDEWAIKNAVALGKSLGANTIVLSSYGFAENGMGVTLAAFRVSEYGKPQATDFTIGMVFGKIPLSKELTTRLSVPLDSLRPKDGVYRSGYGGVSIPACVKCPVPGMKVPDIDLQGMLRAHPQGATVWLQFVVTPEGHTQDIKVVQPVGYGFDEQYVKAAQGWELKPAVDADGKTVPVLYDFNLSFKFK